MQELATGHQVVSLHDEALPVITQIHTDNSVLDGSNAAAASHLASENEEDSSVDQNAPRPSEQPSSVMDTADVNGK